MHSKDFTAHADLRDNNGRVQRIGKTDPLAYPHLQARTHVKSGPGVDADRAYLARVRRLENRAALRIALTTIGGWLAVFAVALAFAWSIFGAPATYSHVRVVDGNAYVLDYGLTAEDCSRVAQAASDDCVRE